jgi:hypothetical protein
VQLSGRTSPGKPKKIKIIDWRQPSKSLDIDDVSEWPSVERELNDINGGTRERVRLPVVAGTKRKETDVDDDYPVQTYKFERWAHNRRVMRAAATYNDDTADPLAVYGSAESAEHDDISAIIARMEDF